MKILNDTRNCKGKSSSHSLNFLRAGEVSLKGRLQLPGAPGFFLFPGVVPVHWLENPQSIGRSGERDVLALDLYEKTIYFTMIMFSVSFPRMAMTI